VSLRLMPGYLGEMDTPDNDAYGRKSVPWILNSLAQIISVLPWKRMPYEWDLASVESGKG